MRPIDWAVVAYALEAVMLVAALVVALGQYFKIRELRRWIAKECQTLETLVDISTRHMPTGDETFVQCLVCGEWDGHTSLVNGEADVPCPIEALSALLDEACP